MNTHKSNLLLAATLTFMCRNLCADTCTLLTNGLSYHITANRTNCLVGEPIVFEIAIINETDSDQKAFTELGMGGGSAAYYELSSDGTNYHTIGAADWTDPRRTTVSIPPHGTYTHEEVILYDHTKRGLAISTSGIYYVRANIPCYPCRSATPLHTVVINVSLPSGYADQQMMGSLTNTVVLEAVTPWFGRNTDKAFPLLCRIAETTSSYQPYAAYYASLMTTSLHERVRLLNIAGKTNFPLAAHALLETSRAYRAMGSKTLADQIERRILNDYPLSSASASVRYKRP